MSFIKHQITLNGNQKYRTHPPKFCNKCNEQRLPEGGIEMGPGRWVCATCWAKRAMKRQPK